MRDNQKKLFKNFGAVFYDINVSTLNQKRIDLLKEALYKNKIVVLKNQNLSSADYLEFAKKLGAPKKFTLKNYSLPDYPEIMVLNNRSNSKKGIGGRKIGNMWHADSSFLKNPLPLTMLYARKVPEFGGDTLFRDMSCCLKQLPDLLIEKIKNKNAMHEVKWTYKVTEKDAGDSISELLERINNENPPAIHPCILKHPVTGKESLYINPGYTTKIIGLGKDENEFILHWISKIIVREKSIHNYKWNLNDLVIWDNRSVLHSATPLSVQAERVMHRIGIDDMKFFG